METPTFTFEMLSKFNAKDVEMSLGTQEALYLIDFSRINELKADIARYILSILNSEDHDYFMWDSAQINKRINELVTLGCEGAVTRFFEYGYWT
jgi:hypothetical protein